MITRLTNGPRHHFFGYYGICPWDAAGRHHLGLETDFDDHAPGVEDTATVGLVDAETGRFEAFGETRAFNLQQGSMLNWIDAGHGGQEFTHNDWEGERLVSRAVNPRTGERRTIGGAIEAVSPTEPIAMGLNYARMSVCRRVVGYANTIYTPANIVPIPADDGLFRLDLRTGAADLLVSMAEVERLLPYAKEPSQPRWFNHVAFNPGGTRMTFFCRVKQTGRFLDSLWSVNTDGTGLECLIEYGHCVSHLAWYGEDRIMVSTDALGPMQFVALTDRGGGMTPFGAAGFPADGHNAFSPDFRRIACDTYPQGPERKCLLLLHDRTTGETVEIGAFPHPEHIRGDWRCDLHPRWSRDGRSITFDSVHEGSRQIYSVGVL